MAVRHLTVHISVSLIHRDHVRNWDAYIHYHRRNIYLSFELTVMNAVP